MIFFDLNDRSAGISALVALYKYMAGRHPDDINKDERNMKNEEIVKKCTLEWDGGGDLEKEAFISMWQAAGLAPNSYYECHLTFDPEFLPLADAENDSIRKIGEGFGWSYSLIDGDEVLGKGLRTHLTRSSKSGEALFKEMQRLCAALEQNGLIYIRRKIEHIVFDEKNVLPRIAGTALAA